MSAPLHNIHPVTRLPPAPPGYVSFKAQRPALLAGGSGPMAIARCTLRAFTYPVTGTQTHPPAPKSTLLLGPTAPSTLSNKRVLLYGLSCTHHLICPAPTLLLPPGPLHRQMRTHCRLAAQVCTYLCRQGILGLVAVAAPPPCLSPSPGYTQARHGRAVAPPSSRPSLPPPYSSPPPNYDTPMPSPSPSLLPSTVLEVECRACASAKHEARAAAAPPHHITSVEIMCAPSPGVTIGLVPKPEPESDTEPDTVIERQPYRQRHRARPPGAVILGPQEFGDA
ncbi:hypothetical protein C8F04DRAFT_1263387 [Mycena alexandri]|uniref:Uncharacterized protein n=1 Tax=Mycena alexandri TaxID=1745969 RepID=A0AAD6SSC4_9AGAR|nr:hypothetical protein C8F04DRAFT_1263387 [Mycena alexandri]